MLCPVGTTSALGAEYCTCDVGWTRFYEDGDCERCPQVGVACRQGKLAVGQPGYYIVPQRVPARIPPVIACLNPILCINDQVNNIACRPGSTGLLCNNCEFDPKKNMAENFIEPSVCRRCFPFSAFIVAQAFLTYLAAYQVSRAMGLVATMPVLYIALLKQTILHAVLTFAVYKTKVGFYLTSREPLFNEQQAGFVEIISWPHTATQCYLKKIGVEDPLLWINVFLPVVMFITFWTPRHVW